MDIVSWTFRNLDLHKNKKVLIDSSKEDRFLSVHDAYIMVRKLISGLQAMGLKGSDVVLIHLFNDILYPVIALGIIGAGGVYLGSNPAYTESEFRRIMELSSARFVITENHLLSRIQPAIDSCGLQHSSIILLDSISQAGAFQEMHSFEELLGYSEREWISIQDYEEAKITPAALLMTSGTSGKPKMAIRTHANLINDLEILSEPTQKPYTVCRLIPLPVFHSFATAIGLLAPIYQGAPTYIMRRFMMEDYLQVVEKHDITESIIVPPIVVQFLQLPMGKHLKLKSLQLLNCAGSILSKEVLLQASNLLSPSGRIVQTWGMTETGWITTIRYPEFDLTGSVGRPLPNTELRLIGDDGSDISTESQSTGEILVRSPSVMPGYFENLAASSETIQNGWLRTGDVGYIKHGLVYLVGRRKDIIKVRGWQIAPAEIEEILLSHHQIMDAAVYGVMAPDSMTEIVHAMVVPKPSAALEESDVRAYLLEHIARYKVKEAVIGFREFIPRNSSGKILRHILRSEAETDIRNRSIRY